VVIILGDSMEDTFSSGDRDVVEPMPAGAKSIATDAIYFFRLEDGLHVQQLEKKPGWRLVARPRNKNYEPFELSPSDDYEIYGRMWGMWKRYWRRDGTYEVTMRLDPVTKLDPPAKLYLLKGKGYAELTFDPDGHRGYDGLIRVPFSPKSRALKEGSIATFSGAIIEYGNKRRGSLQVVISGLTDSKEGLTVHFWCESNEPPAQNEAG